MGVNDFIQVGDRIKSLRKKKGISQKDMAKLIGIPYTTYSNYENNNREPNTEALIKIANALDINVLVLLGDVSEHFINDIQSDVNLNSAYMALFKNIYGAIDIEQVNDENGKYYYYKLGSSEKSIMISELAYENITEAVETLIRKMVSLAATKNIPQNIHTFNTTENNKDD